MWDPPRELEPHAQPPGAPARSLRASGGRCDPATRVKAVSRRPCTRHPTCGVDRVTADATCRVSAPMAPVTASPAAIDVRTMTPPGITTEQNGQKFTAVLAIVLNGKTQFILWAEGAQPAVAPPRRYFEDPIALSAARGTTRVDHLLRSLAVAEAEVEQASRAAEKRSASPRVLGQWASTPAPARPFAPRGTPVPA